MESLQASSWCPRLETPSLATFQKGKCLTSQGKDAVLKVKLVKQVAKLDTLHRNTKFTCNMEMYHYECNKEYSKDCKAELLSCYDGLGNAVYTNINMVQIDKKIPDKYLENLELCE